MTEHGPKTDKKKIMIAEGESLVARDVQLSLSGMGYEVSAVVSSGKEAVACAERLRPDLILMDIVLEGDLDGIEAGRQVRSRYDIPVVFLTDGGHNEISGRPKPTSSYGCVIKPIDDRSLRMTIETAFHRHTAEKRLKDGEERYRQLVELSPDGVLVQDSGEIVFVNSAGFRILGAQTAESLIGRPVLSIVHPDYRDLVRSSESRLRSTMKDELRPFTVLKLLRIDGSAVDVEVGEGVVTCGDKRSVQMIFRDITDRKRAEAELMANRQCLADIVEEQTIELRTTVQLLTQEIDVRRNAEETLKKSEKKFRKLSQEFNTLLDAIPDTLFLVDPHLKVLWANRGALTNLGIEMSEMTGRHCYEVWHNRSLPCEGCHSLKSFKTGKAAFLKLLFGDGRLFESRSFPIMDEEGHISAVIVMAVDVTEKTSLQAEAMRSSHLASLGELAAGVAHEINNPINGIINYAQILERTVPAETRERDIAQRIMKEGNRIAGIVNNLLSFARERREEKLPVQPKTILQDTVMLTEALIAKEGTRLDIHIPDGLPDIVANAPQIQQVFLNVISNSRYALNTKYKDRHEDKTITVRAERYDSGDRTYVRISFADRGTGIPAVVLEKVMNPFFSTKPAGQGTGLGLSISHGIIRDHGGRISIESAEGKGTTVIIDLVAAETDGA